MFCCITSFHIFYLYAYIPIVTYRNGRWQCDGIIITLFGIYFSVLFYSAPRDIYKANLDGSGRMLVAYTALMPSLAVNADKKRICGVEQCISKIF